MRLLPKNQVAQKVEDLREGLIRERNSIASEISELTKRKNIVRTEVEREGNELSQTLLAMEQEFREKRDALRSEIESLEERRREVLRPLDDVKSHLDERQKIIEGQTKAINVMAEKIGRERSELALKLAEISDRETTVREQEARSNERLLRVAEAESLNKKSTRALGDAWARQKEQSAIIEKMHAQRESSLYTREKEVESGKKWIEDQKKEIETARAKLSSDQFALRIAFEEGEKKGYIKKI